MIKKIVLAVAVLGLFGGGFLGWQWKKESEVGFLRFEDFNIRNVSDKKIIENEKMGVKAEAPIDWRVEDGGPLVAVFFISPDFQLHSKATGPYSPPIPEKGCVFGMNVKKEIESSEYDIEYSFIREKIEICLKSPNDCGYGKIIKVSGHNALKQSYSPKDSIFSGKYVYIKVPTNEIIYTFDNYLFSDDPKKCEHQFDEFLKIVSIK